MILKLILFMLKYLTAAKKKAVLLIVIQELQSSKNSSIDQQLAESILETIAKSSGNTITHYYIKG